MQSYTIPGNTLRPNSDARRAPKYHEHRWMRPLAKAGTLLLRLRMLNLTVYIVCIKNAILQSYGYILSAKEVATQRKETAFSRVTGSVCGTEKPGRFAAGSWESRETSAKFSNRAIRLPGGAR